MLLFREILRPVITVCFFFAWSQDHRCKPIRKLNSNSKHQEVVSHYIFKESVNLPFFCLCAFLRHEINKNGIKKSWVDQDSNP